MIKKYFTLSFDDGIEQDKRLLEILRKYNLKATFNINTGLLGTSMDLRSLGINADHNAITENDIQNGLYNGFEVAVHTLNHPSLASLKRDDIIKEVKADSDNIERLTGTRPIGMAYPGGTADSFNDNVIDIIVKNTEIRYARTSLTTKSFKLPDCFMKWDATCHVMDDDLLKLSEEFINIKPKEQNLLFYVWGHSYEFDQFDAWDRFEEFCRYISEREDILYNTNGEIYLKFGC